MPTTSTPTDPKTSSTATTAAGGSLNPQRIQVRERKPGRSLDAYQLTKDDEVILQSGHRVRAFTGEWVVCSGSVVIDTVSPARFEQFYEKVGEPAFVIDPADRTQLEQSLGFGTTRDSKTLTLAVLKLASLSIGDIKKNFSVAQWEEIARRAEKRRMTPSAYMDFVVERLLSDLWTSAL